MNSPITGLVIAALILLPQVFFYAYPAKQGATKDSKNQNRIFLVLERFGLFCCILFLLIFSEKFRTAEFSILLGLWMTTLLIYLFLWIRYFAKGRDLSLLTRPFLFFPMPSAVFSALTFFFVGLWISSAPVYISAVVYAVGHIFLTHYRTNK